MMAETIDMKDAPNVPGSLVKAVPEVEIGSFSVMLLNHHRGTALEHWEPVAWDRDMREFVRLPALRKTKDEAVRAATEILTDPRLYAAAVIQHARLLMGEIEEQVKRRASQDVALKLCRGGRL